MVKRLLEKGIPIDGIGIQGHVRLPGSEGLIHSLEGAIEKFAELKKIKPDFVIQITELDVTLYEWQDTSKEKEFTPALQIEQAKLYQAIFEMCRRQAEKGNLELVTLWGLNDYSWLNDFPVAGRTDHPLLFDRDFHVKPAFWGVADPSKIEECANELSTT
jgi:endo-1,4-beta-xylanase